MNICQLSFNAVSLPCGCCCNPRGRSSSTWGSLEGSDSQLLPCPEVSHSQRHTKFRLSIFARTNLHVSSINVSRADLLAPAGFDAGYSHNKGRCSRWQNIFKKPLWLKTGLATASLLDNNAACEAEKVMTVVSFRRKPLTCKCQAHTNSPHLISCKLHVLQLSPMYLSSQESTCCHSSSSACNIN